jgi:hypothetical protein
MFLKLYDQKLPTGNIKVFFRIGYKSVDTLVNLSDQVLNLPKRKYGPTSGSRQKKPIR